jgi:flagellar biosynthesis/type III secretory pathway ATPase
MRYRDQNGQHWADIIDVLTMYADARRRVVRALGELTAETHP